MKKSKIVDLLKSFNNDEIRKFNDFVKSPFFNKEKILSALADYLCNCHSAFTDPELEKEKVFAHLYPGKKYNDGLMRNIMSDLLRLTEEFLAAKNFKDDNINKELHVLEEFYNRKLWKHFQKHKEKTDAEIEKDGFKNMRYYENKAKLTNLYLGFLRETDITFKKTHGFLQETSDLVTAGALMKLLYYNTYMVSVQNNIGNIVYRLNLANEIDDYFIKEGKHYLQIPYIEAYWLSFKLFKTKEEKYFYMLKESFQKNFNQISDADKSEIYSALQYYAFLNEGRAEFGKELFILYKHEVEQRFNKISTKHIDQGSFMTFVRRGLGAGESKWTEDFIQSYINKVPKKFRADTLLESNAAVYYYYKNYNSALKELAKITSGTLQFKLNIKSLTLKIYFDLNEIEQFYSHVDTYKHFIFKNKLVHERVKENINNYISYSKKLFDIKNSSSSEKEFLLRQLRKEILENQAVTEKIWLLKKAEELGALPL